MKLISLILSIIILTLAFVPCAEADMISVGSTEQTEHEHTDGDHEHDDCTPFCSCDCCGVPIVVPVLFWFEVNEFECNFSFSFYYSFQYSFDYTDGVWYPPTLS